jgi:hypothetical protein
MATWSDRERKLARQKKQEAKARKARARGRSRKRRGKLGRATGGLLYW